MASVSPLFFCLGKGKKKQENITANSNEPQIQDMFVQKFLACCLQLPTSFLKVFLLSDMIFSVVNKGSGIYINCIEVGAWLVKKKKSHTGRVIISGLLPK